MKKQAKILIIVSLMMLVIPVLSFATGNPKLYISNVEKYENDDKVTLNIAMDNIEASNNMVVLGINVKYDPEKLEYKSSKAGKDLESTIKYCKNITEEGRVAIAIINTDGFDKNGSYYTVTFRIKKDVTDNIPIELEVKEATDDNGNNITIETKNTLLKIYSDDIKEKKELVPTNQKIEEFEVTKVEPVTSIETVITEKANIEIKEDDILSYEVEDSSVIELLDDGTIIPNQDGTTKVKLKLNGQDIGTTVIEVKDGKIVSITGNEEIVPEKYETKVNISELEGVYSKEEIEKSLNYNIEDITVKASDGEKTGIDLKIVFAIIIILFLIFIYIKNHKKERKND